MMISIIVWGNIALLWAITGCLLWLQIKNEREFLRLEKRRAEVYDQLTDQDRILDEFEKGARLREMKDANRTTLPRDDAVGQNARVFRPKMRAKKPSHWNPPRA